jgi:hypothetical protein
MNGIYTVKFGSRTLAFKYTFRAVKALQNRLGCKVSELEKRFENPDIDDMEALIHYGLLWKNKDLTAEEAEEIIEEASVHGKFYDCLNAASKALGYFFAGESGLKNVAKKAQARNGIGKK